MVAATVAPSTFGGPVGGVAPELEAVPFRLVNLLSQQRKTYDEIPELADEFAANGWLEPPLLAVQTPAQVPEYIDYVNRVFSAHHGIGELMWLPGRPRRCAIAIAGHRRFLANAWLYEHGCSWCRQEYGIEPPGTCFARHSLYHNQGKLVGDQVLALCYHGIHPRDALLKQCSENHHRRPPAHEVADSIDRHFAVMAADEPEITTAEFARRAKLRPEMVRRARRYVSLPEYVRSDVESGRMQFSVAMELGRLARQPTVTEAVVETFYQNFLVQRPTLNKAARLIDAQISHSTHWVSFEGMSDDDLSPEVKKAFRQPFEAALARVIYAASPLFKRAKEAIADGRMGLPDSLFRDTSVMHAWRETVAIMEALLPDLRKRLGEAEAEHDQRVLTEMATLLRLVEPTEDRQTHQDSSLFAVVGD